MTVTVRPACVRRPSSRRSRKRGRSDFREAIDYRPIIRAACLAASAVFLALLFGLAAPRVDADLP